MDELAGEIDEIEIDTAEQKTDVLRCKVNRHTANGEMLMICVFFVSTCPMMSSLPLWMAEPRGLDLADWSRYYVFVAIVAAIVGLFSWIALRAQGKAKKARAALVALELEIT